jgi:hypothetical protein
MKLDQVEQNALHYLNSVEEFTLPDDPIRSPKAAAIARVMKSLVKKGCAIVVDTSDDTPPRPRWGITDEGRRLARPVH